jgi:hypothetical protein
VIRGKPRDLMESRVYEKELAKEAGNETDSSSVNVATA